MLPKDWILEAPGTALGAQNDPLDSNLEARDPSNGDPNPKKTMLEDKQFPASIFKGFGRRFWSVFGTFFDPKMHAKNDKPDFSENFKNSDFPIGKP